MQNFSGFFRGILRQKWHNIFIISTWARKSIHAAIQCRSNLCRVHFLDADLGFFSCGNTSVPLYPSASKRCLQRDHAAETTSFYQGLEGDVVTRPVLEIKNSCISNDWIICKIFNLISKCFKVTEVPFFAAKKKKGTAGLPVPLILE